MEDLNPLQEPAPLRKEILLEDIPDEVLQNIARFLDRESLFILARMNVRLQQIIRPFFRTLKSEKVSRKLLEWVEWNGSVVQKLDLSDCVSKRETLEQVIEQCPQITELNVINSNFGTPSVLCRLRRLETLYFTETSRVRLDVSCCQKPCITARKISIETGVQHSRLEKVMRFLKRCEVAEEIIVHLSGTSEPLDTPPVLPYLQLEIWETLHTVVCTRHMSVPNRASAILRSIFTTIITPGILRWIEEDKLCYIYEHGQFNGQVTDVVPLVDAERSYLAEFHHVNLSAASDTARIFRSSWGSPRSVSIAGLSSLHTSTEGAISETLTELDLRGCHGNFSGRFKVALIASSPRLRDLASSRCFFLFCGGGNDEQGGSSFQKEEFENALRRRQLKKLHVEGTCHTQRCAVSCPCRHPPQCESCLSGPQLTSANLVNMRAFGYLDELTLSGVAVDCSALENITNSNVSVVRLLLTGGTYHEGLSDFLDGCGDLKCFKLESLDFDILSIDVWEALSKKKELVKICLGTGDIQACDPEKEVDIFTRMRQFIEPVFERAEFIHLHCSSDELRRIFRRLTCHMSPEMQLKMRLTREALPQNIKFIYGDSIRRGRALCLSESSAGVVPPQGWDIN